MMTGADTAVQGSSRLFFSHEKTEEQRIRKLLLRHTMENDGRILEGVFDSAEQTRRSEK